MKLYKYLLISDELITKTELFELGGTDFNYENMFYTYKASPELVFMSFQYKNNGEHKTAYTLVDSDDVFRIDKYIHDNKHSWNSSHDTEGPRQIDEVDSEYLLKALIASKKYKEGQALPETLKTRHKIRTGGYVTSPKLKLHEYLLKVSGNTESKYVHHNGHTFDNRKKFLTKVSKELHDSVHKKWEPVHNIYRAKKVKTGDFNATSLACNCGTLQNDIKLHDCRNCCAVLLIETEQQLKDFLDEIHSPDYQKLKDNSFYKF